VPPRAYRRYLRSSHWKTLRRRYRESGLSQVCAVCGDPKSELHHRSYSRLGREHLLDLVPLCETHHGGLHRMIRSLRQRGKRITVEQATGHYIEAQRLAPHNRRARGFWRDAEQAMKRHQETRWRHVIQQARESGKPAKGGLVVRKLSAAELRERRAGLERYQENAA
jgi:hypothetical protein